tara:strand:- start:629 stop:2977 length:2349 start_codon:yes stop_codon:yes gene_type:complete
MASIKYLQNINLFGSQLQNAVIQPLGAAPTVYGDGQIYYDTGVDKLFLRANSAWVAIQTGTEVSYDLAVPVGTTAIRLTGGGDTDDVNLVGGTNVTITRNSATQLTISATDSAAGTVTSVAGGDGISISGSATVTPTVNIDYTGTDNAILVPNAATPVGADTMWFSDATDNNIKKATISAFPGFGKDGTVTSVTAGTALSLESGSATINPTLGIDYLGADNIILAAADGTGVTVVASDRLLVSDATDSNAKYVNISQITSAIGGGTVTSVNGSGGSTGLTLTGGAITTSGTLTLGGTLNAAGGGTGQSSYTVGDILYASSTTALAKLGIGGSGQVLKVNSGIPSWQADSGVGVSSITLAGDNGSGGSITSTGTITVAGTGVISTSVSGTTVTVSSSATTNTGTVTSIATPSDGGLTGGTITTSGNLRLKNYASLVDNKVLKWDNSNNQLEQGSITDNGSLVTLSGSLTVTSGFAGSTGSFSGQVTVPLTPTSDNNIASKAYVLSQIGGVGGFRGGYNASTNSPALSGGSNVAMALGDFFVVDTAGNSAGLGTLEPGDFVFADAAISAGSSPPASAYTVVIADQNIAGVGSTDGGTVKGVSGFSSASFAGTSNGFITIKSGGISDAQLASTFNKIIGTDSDVDTSGVQVIDVLQFTDGVATSVSTRSLPNAATGSVGVTEIATQAEVDAGSDSFRYVTPATLASHISNKQSFAGTYPASDSASWSVAHGLGTRDVSVQVYEISSGETVFVGVARASSSPFALTLTTSGTTTANTLRVLVSKIG